MALDSYNSVPDMERQRAENGRLWSDWIDWLRGGALAGFEVT